MVNPDFSTLLQQRQQRTEALLRKILGDRQVPVRLQAAMQYAVLGGGKRIRPMLAWSAAVAVGGYQETADMAACAVELIHAYSLIHDDLPAMDDDVLRRGRATCHVAYDEATAILAGDALQTLAFELVAVSKQLYCGHGIRLKILTELVQASGWKGMVAGQTLDIAASGSLLSEAELSHMHALKTGALITASVVTGALSTNMASDAQLSALRQYAGYAGLAFQIRDDILDVETATAVSGKEQGKDARHNKPTYTTLLGVEGARARLDTVAAEAIAALQPFGKKADQLRDLTRYIVDRSA